MKVIYFEGKSPLNVLHFEMSYKTFKKFDFKQFVSSVLIADTLKS